MLIKVSPERTGQIKFQPPGCLQWEDGSGARCTWAGSTPCSLSHRRLPLAYGYSGDAVALAVKGHG